MKPHRLTFSIPNARELILSGKKTQTLRLASHRGTVQAGDPLVLEEWVGKPRAKGSKRRVVMRATCSEVIPLVVRLDHSAAPVAVFHQYQSGPRYLHKEDRASLANRDGFDSWAELVDVLRGFYGKRPVEMTCIRW